MNRQARQLAHCEPTWYTSGTLEPFTEEDGVMPIDMEDGLQQGFPPSGAICSLQLLPHTKAANAILVPSGGRSRGYQDDHRHVGPIVEALAAAKCFKDGIKTCLGLDVKPIKRMVYSPDRATRADLRNRGVTLGIVRADGSWIRTNDDDYAQPPPGAGYGIMVMGVPVGDEPFIAAVMAKKARGTVSKNSY